MRHDAAAGARLRVGAAMMRPARRVSAELPAFGITPAALSALEADAIARYATEEEACGYLTGPAGDPALCDRVHPMVNLAKKLHARDPVRYFRSAKTSFAFLEQDLERAVRAGDAQGEPVKVVYHSHLDQDAYLSATDAAVFSGGAPPAKLGAPAVLGPGPRFQVAFLVSSVRRDGERVFVAEHRLYAYRDRSFVDVPLTVREPRKPS
ncbi:Sulfur carrier protein adenylyltransferase ThiF [Minicystis rosea]|nr:Sulfur carrier protein adenylyltransferase ThiF [Minicystis rosea]